MRSDFVLLTAFSTQVSDPFTASSCVSAWLLTYRKYKTLCKYGFDRWEGGGELPRDWNIFELKGLPSPGESPCRMGAEDSRFWNFFTLDCVC